MIINCENCNKKFNLDINLVNKKGRLLQCGNCNYRWFYKPASALEDKKILVDKLKNLEKFKNSKNKKINNKKNNNIISIFIVILISLISIIIIFDTFKEYISLILPGIKPLLENLYETLHDLLLFIKDLFK